MMPESTRSDEVWRRQFSSYPQLRDVRIVEASDTAYQFHWNAKSGEPDESKK
jgi:hypothetical protein